MQAVLQPAQVTWAPFIQLFYQRNETLDFVSGGG